MGKKYIVVVDDNRTLYWTPPEGEDIDIVHLRTSDAAIEWFEEHKGKWVDQIFLDHDLGTDPETGQDIDTRPFAVYLATLENEYATWIEDIFVHSLNPYGADWLVKELQPKYACCRIPCPESLRYDPSVYEEKNG